MEQTSPEGGVSDSGFSVDESAKAIVVAVTGHRPHKLWGYDYGHPNYQLLKKRLRELLIELRAAQAISGMALGVDTLFAIAALELEVPLIAAIPCLGHSSVWPIDSQQLYEEILSHPLVTRHLVSNESYRPQLMQTRNEWMVDRCDHLIAVWNGSGGGTANCVRYAQKLDKPITIINPKELA